MKYSISQALLAAVRILSEGGNAELTVMPRSLICSHFFNDLPAARRRSGGPPIDRWWISLAFNGKSHLRDQANACWIDDLSSCCCLLGALSFTSSAKNKWLQVNSSAKSLKKFQEEKGPKQRALGHITFYGTFTREGAAHFYSKSSVL